MNFIDIFLAVLLLYGAIRGFISGLIIQISSLIGFVLGIYLALRFSDLFASTLVDDYGIQQTSYLPIVSFAILFVAVLIGIFFLGKGIKMLLKVTMLSPIDKIGGAILGMMKYVIIFGMAFNFLNHSEPPIHLISEETIEESVLYSPVMKTSSIVVPFVSKGVSFIKFDNQDSEEDDELEE